MRLITTTREQILTQASQANSDRLRDLVSDPARYAIAMTSLDPVHRAEILMNHLYFSELPATERERIAADTRMRTLVVHPSYNPRLIEAITKRPLRASTADTLLDDLAETIANPVKVWEVTFGALNDLAKEIIFTLASFPPRPIPYRDLQRIAAPKEALLSWQEAFKSLEPSWIKVTGAGRTRFVTFSNPGCRDYILGRLNDDDLAEDRVYSRMATFEQLISLSQSAGLLTVDLGVQPTPSRAKLAGALLSRRAELSTFVEQWWEEWATQSERSIGQKLLRLRDAAALSTIYTNDKTATWLIRRIIDLITGPDGYMLPCVEGLALARQLYQIPSQATAERDDTAHRLIITALGSARSIRDLYAYESLPDEIRTSEIHEIAGKRAMPILGFELDSLADESTDPRMLEDSARELRQLARWYGYELDIDPLLDLIDGLSSASPDSNAGDSSVSTSSPSNRDYQPEQRRARTHVEKREG